MAIWICIFCQLHIQIRFHHWFCWPSRGKKILDGFSVRTTGDIFKIFFDQNFLKLKPQQISRQFKWWQWHNKNIEWDQQTNWNQQILKTRKETPILLLFSRVIFPWELLIYKIRGAFRGPIPLIAFKHLSLYIEKIKFR